MKKSSVVLSVCFSLFILQTLHTTIRLAVKSNKQFSQQETNFIDKVEALFSEHKVQLEPYPMLYMQHNGDDELIRHYFASQYALAPKVVSDKPKHQFLTKLHLHHLEDGSIALQLKAIGQ